MSLLTAYNIIKMAR
ncbi:hypothetical protein VTL71DRAFT_14057 [Oculimacula yallundae]|uniref:Uncharacterized protein n=1 Tax=Oculimacula yallundae TaxID=86028 RepID=A0ABR4CFE2_9HELO